MQLRIALSRIIFGALTTSAVTIGLASSSEATPEDQAFLERLNNVGITYTNAYGTTLSAQGVCRELSRGTPHTRVVDMVLVDYPTFSWDGAADYVVTANMTYCPKFQ